jgi:REP element-mobilizing transposase RayT
VRQNRVQPPETTHHISAHANEDGAVIYADDNDRRTFLNTLSDTINRYGWQLHAYCLMDTHYHLLLHTPDETLARGMGRLNGVYAQIFNRRHRRRGHLFRDRYWSTPLVTDEHLLLAMRYIPRNPVAAGLCATAADWPWSNYRATAGLVKPPAFLEVAWTRRMFAPNPEDACGHYRAFLAGDRLLRGLSP